MPIKASADKLAREVQLLGNPPVFPSLEEDSNVEDTDEAKPENDNIVAPDKFKSKRSKAAAKSAKEDLKAFGLGCDWRRSFITTDMNPFYDSFVRWQMRKLKILEKIVKDTRYTIYSPFDGQPCVDHDRASGEGVQPQDNVLIKMEVVPPFISKLTTLEGRKVYRAAATLSFFD